MKKTLVTILVIVLLIAGLFTLTACDKTKEDNSNEITLDSESNNDYNEEILEVGSNSPEEIIGQWKNHSYGYDFIYTFEDDGKGNYNAAGKDMPFTYTIDGNKISILYDGDTESFDTTFSIDGDTLNVVDSMGEDTLYEKVK